MRIAEISTLARPVPPVGEGSVESLVWEITKSLVERGHEVTLFATADSKTSATLRSPVKTSYTSDPGMWNWEVYEAAQAREAFMSWRDFDIIHCHSYHFGLLFCDFVPTPSLHSIHTEPGPDCLFLARQTRNRRLHFASSYQAREFKNVRGTSVAPWGIDVDSYPFLNHDERKGYLAFLGRMIPEKGVMQSIDLAQRAGIPLKIAAPENEYYREIVHPRIDGRSVEYVGELDNAGKKRFLSEASALIYPVSRGEPFGLVLIEAMACGTPVVASNRGAVPEIVRHGESGWIVESEGDLDEGLSHLDRFDCALIRKYAQDNFSISTMMNRLESLMADIVKRGAS